MEIFGILILYAAKKDLIRKAYSSDPLWTTEKVYLVFLYLGYLLCISAAALSLPEYAISAPRIMIVAVWLAFAVCVFDIMSDLMGLVLKAKKAAQGFAISACILAIVLPITYLIARLQGLYWYDNMSFNDIVVRDVFVGCTGLVIAKSVWKDFHKKKQ